MNKSFIALLCATSAALPAVGSESPADSTLILDEVVVTGSNAAVPARLMPYTVSVVTRAELESSG